MAAQSGRGTFPDTPAVPLADGRADDHSEEVCQACGTAGIYGMNLCKTEKFQSVAVRAADVLPPVVRTVPAMIFPAVYAVYARVPFWGRMYQGQPP